MSGGVDSSVAAARCVEAGFTVFGIMLRLWAEPGGTTSNRCCTPAAVEEARAVAACLGIPFSVIDVEDVFKQLVVDPFVTAAAAGDTPNPCFTCNRQLRFGYLLEQAQALGADLLATGHYARTECGPDGRYRLLRGVDRHKDQSYMLYRLGQAELARALFPVGEHAKTEVRALADRFGLPVASRADSMDLCWLGPAGLPGFLTRHLPPGTAVPGPIEDQAGHVIGQHAGLQFFTIGQRRGLGVATGKPVFVLRRDRARNALVVGPAEQLLTRTVAVRQMHWVNDEPPTGPLRVEAQIRYRALAAPATLELAPDGTAAAVFDRPQRAPTPGQGLVAYRNDECLGGGLIQGRDEPQQGSGVA